METSLEDRINGEEVAVMEKVESKDYPDVVIAALIDAQKFLKYPHTNP